MPDDLESVAEHARSHAEWERAVRAHGRAPVSYSERDEMKERGRDKRRNGKSLADRVGGAETELRALFERSFDEAIKRGFGVQHVKEVEYVRMAAEGDILCDAEVSDIIFAKFAFLLGPKGRIVGSLWEP